LTFDGEDFFAIVDDEGVLDCVWQDGKEKEEAACCSFHLYTTGANSVKARGGRKRQEEKNPMRANLCGLV